MKIDPLSSLFLIRWLPGAAAIFLLLLPAAQSRAAVVNYTATNLADTTPGQDLWQYSYQLSQFAFSAGQGFTIFFDRTLFTLLQSPPPAVSPAWDPLTVQPDIPLNSDGFYDALALVGNPTLAVAFTVQAVWLGAGSPGAQPYTIYDTNFTPIVQGQTIPEPGTALLLLSALGVFAARRRRTRTRSGGLQPPRHASLTVMNVEATEPRSRGAIAPRPVPTAALGGEGAPAPCSSAFPVPRNHLVRPLPAIANRRSL